MNNKIILDNKNYHMEENNLPCLINYAPKTGGSHLTITMVADLFLRGSKILFFTAYSMARDNFLEQIGDKKSEIAFVNNEKQLDISSRAIILESGNEELFLRAVDKINDLEDRVVLVKNIEVFNEAVINSCLGIKKVILSGNLDECITKRKLMDKEYKTVVVFNEPDVPLEINIPKLNKYEGYLWSNKKDGIMIVK